MNTIKKLGLPKLEGITVLGLPKPPVTPINTDLTFWKKICNFARGTQVSVDRSSHRHFLHILGGRYTPSPQASQLSNYNLNTGILYLDFSCAQSTSYSLSCCLLTQPVPPQNTFSGYSPTPRPFKALKKPLNTPYLINIQLLYTPNLFRVELYISG